MQRQSTPWWSRLAPVPPASERDLWVCIVLFAVLTGLLAGITAVQLMA